MIAVIYVIGEIVGIDCIDTNDVIDVNDRIAVSCVIDCLCYYDD